MRFLLIVPVLLFLATSCIQNDAGCVNVTDCPEGYLCEEGTCVPSETGDSTGSHNDNSVMDNVTVNDNTVVNDESAVDQNSQNDSDDNGLPPQDTDAVSTDENFDETPDEIPDDSVDCDAGWHFEDEGDDENGDGKYSCVENVACTSEPCNGGQCVDKGLTATCSCLTGYAGRWCADCDTGYLKSTVDEKCKPDCATGTYDCTGTKECGIDPGTNEAGCVCKENYSGTDCSVCDPTVFCNSHVVCYASTGSPVCTCDAMWSGDAICSTCTEGYLFEGGNCIEGCKYYCGATELQIIDSALVTATSYGTCQIISGEATCVCDAGWKDPFLKGLVGIYIIPECSECDTSNPPAGGCPEE